MSIDKPKPAAALRLASRVARRSLNLLRRIFRRLGLTRPPAVWQSTDPNGSTWSEMLCVEPLIIHAMPSKGFPVGNASVIGPLVRDRRAHFLLMLPWTIEPPHDSLFLIETARSYLRDHRQHRLIFLTNT